ncbi:MAG: hydrogenase expression/formation protein HypE [Candidatus Omnitrophota bacterium]
MKSDFSEFSPGCPLPLKNYQHVLLAHGGGGQLMHEMISEVFHAAFRNPILDTRHDSAVLASPGQRLAFTTDSYVVHPLFFPGGDIGSLAVYGTVNDLAMSGARPLFISTGFIIEEGLPMETLVRIVRSMSAAAQKANVQIVTGDTKVVDRGKGDGVYINTAGIGVLEHDSVIGPLSIQPGDLILVNGDIGRHGMAVMATREGLEYESEITSDSAPLAALVQKLMRAGIPLHCLRDVTRGGLSTTLNELAQAAGLNFLIGEDKVPVQADVRGACEILGFDPLYVACEGRMVLFIPESHRSQALALLRDDPEGKQAAVIGQVRGPDPRGLVCSLSPIGVERILDMLSGEQLPRIC